MNWYVAQNLIVHNCRCYEEPIFDEIQEEIEPDVGPATSRSIDPEDGDEREVDAQALLRRGVTQQPGVGADPVKMEKARAAIRAGQRQPIVVTVSPEGDLDLVDGRHRLKAAAEAGVKVKVHFVRGAPVAART